MDRINTASATTPQAILLNAIYVTLLIAPAAISVICFIKPAINPSLLYVCVEIFMIVTLALAAKENRTRFTLPRRSSVILAATVVLTSAIGGTLNAIAINAAYGHLAITIAHMIFGALLFGLFSCVWHDQRRTLLIATLAGATIQILTIFIVIGFASQDPNYDWLYFHAGVGNVRQLGFVGIAAASIAAGLASTTNCNRALFSYYFALLAAFILLNLIGGRASAIAGLLAVGLTHVLACNGKRLKLFLYSVLAYLISIPLSLVYVPPHQSWGVLRLWWITLDRYDQGDITSGRIRHWIETTARFLEHPFVGHGEGQYVHIVRLPGMFLNHPHNFVLQFLFQWGFIGTFAISILVLNILLRSGKSLNLDERVLIPSGALLFSMAAMGLLEGNFYHVFPCILSTLALSIIATSSSRPNPNNI